MCVHVCVCAGIVYLSVVYSFDGFKVLIWLFNLIVLITLCLPSCLTDQKDFIFVFICKKP